MDPYTFSIDGTPKFSTWQVELFGCPSYYGWDHFEVIETSDSIEYVADYYQEKQIVVKERKKHLYVRRERFETILSQLMCQSINVSKRKMESNEWEDMIDEVSEIEDNHWLNARVILKKRGFKTYYNRIPGILARALKLPPLDLSKYKDIIGHFEMMDFYFDKIKEECGRTYFPNLRYTALRLMQHHGVQMHFDIPLAITKYKISELDETFDFIWEFINKRLEEG